MKKFQDFSPYNGLHWESPLNSLQFTLNLSFGPWTVWFPLKSIIWGKKT